MLVLAIDAYASLIDEAEARQQQAAGVGLFIQCLWTIIAGRWHSPDAAVPNLDAFRSAGVARAGYCAVVADGSWSVDNARRVAGEHWNDLKFLALDVEVEGTSAAALMQAVNHTRSLGKEPVIYSANWFWTPWIRSWQGWDFSGVKSWLADYDSVAMLDTVPLERLGPVTGKQYRGTTLINAGDEADFSVFDSQIIVLEADMGMTEEQLKRLAKVEDDIEAAKALIVANGIEVDGKVLTGEEAWQYAIAGGYSLLKAVREQVDHNAIVNETIAVIKARLGG